MDTTLPALLSPPVKAIATKNHLSSTNLAAVLQSAANDRDASASGPLLLDGQIPESDAAVMALLPIVQAIPSAACCS